LSIWLTALKSRALLFETTISHMSNHKSGYFVKSVKLGIDKKRESSN